MEPEIKWQEPPGRRHGGGGQSRWPDIFAALRERPNAWALVCEAASASHVTNIRQGRYKGCEPGEFDAVATKRPDGKHDIYARYVGAETREAVSA